MTASVETLRLASVARRAPVGVSRAARRPDRGARRCQVVMTHNSAGDRPAPVSWGQKERRANKRNG
jgi:hypothetical protein